jgi:Inner membrane component of T3SS, cytoplasmic domain
MAPKFCSNGHQMEEEWPICPYCQRAGFQRTNIVQGADKTRLESSGESASSAVTASSNAVTAALPDVRKTVVLASLQRQPVVGWLVAMNGRYAGQDFRLRDGQNFIGSNPGLEVTIDEPAISAKHASVRYREGVFSLTDLDSTNGTFVNDNPEPVARIELRDNDVVRVGDVFLKFKCL